MSTPKKVNIPKKKFHKNLTVSKPFVIFVKQPFPQVKLLRDLINLWDFYRMLFSSLKI